MRKQPNVLIVGGYAPQYEKMYESKGWNVLPSSFENIEKADLLQFTGGEDVTPVLYGQKPHPFTHFNQLRDEYEQSFFEAGLDYAIPMVGICRGGQFLNVMNHGTMLQHVEGHAIGRNHLSYDVVTGEEYSCSSTHHQMMVANPLTGYVIGIAHEVCTARHNQAGTEIDLRKGIDTEVVFYPRSKSLCFQPHPEYVGAESCREWFFELLDRYFGL